MFQFMYNIIITLQISGFQPNQEVVEGTITVPNTSYGDYEKIKSLISTHNISYYNGVTYVDLVY